MFESHGNLSSQRKPSDALPCDSYMDLSPNHASKDSNEILASAKGRARMGMTGEWSTAYAPLMSGNNCKTGRVPRGRFFMYPLALLTKGLTASSC